MIRFVIGFGRFWWDFIVGEDWKIAAGVAVVLTAISLLSCAGILAVVTVSIVGGAIASVRRG